MSQIRRFQVGGRFQYAGDEYDREDFYNQVIKNKDAFLQQANFTPRELELFNQGYRDLITSLGNTEFTKLPTGEWVSGVSSNGVRDKNFFGRTKKTDNNAIGFATGLLDYTLKRMKKVEPEQPAELPEYQIDLAKDITNKYFGGQDFDYSVWERYDELNPETKTRNNNVRAGMLADMIQSKIDEINSPDFDTKYKLGTSYENKQDLLDRLTRLEDSLRNNTLDDTDYTSAAALGLSYIPQLLGDLPVEEEDKDKEKGVVVKEGIPVNPEVKEVKEKPTLSFDDWVKAGVDSGLKDIWTANLTDYNDYPDVSNTIVPIKGSQYEIPKDYKMNWLTKPSDNYGNYIASILNSFRNKENTGVWSPSILDKNWYYYLGENSINPETFAAFKYNPTTGEIGLGNLTETEGGMEILRTMYDDLTKVVKHQEGGTISRKASILNSILAARAKQNVARYQEEARKKQAEKTEKQRQERADKTVQNSAIASAVLDIVSAGTAFVPVYGTAISALTGLGSSISNFVGDIKKDGMDGGDWTNLAKNIGLDVVGLIPGLGVSAKATKLAKAARTILKLGTTGMMGLGLTETGMNVIRKISEGEAPTFEEWGDILSGLTASVTGFKGLRRANKFQNILDNANKRQVRVLPTEQGKKYISAEQYPDLARLKGVEAQQKFLNDRYESAPTLTRQVSNFGIKGPRMNSYTSLNQEQAKKNLDDYINSLNRKWGTNPDSKIARNIPGTTARFYNRKIKNTVDNKDILNLKENRPTSSSNSDTKLDYIDRSTQGLRIALINKMKKEGKTARQIIDGLPADKRASYEEAREALFKGTVEKPIAGLSQDKFKKQGGILKAQVGTRLYTNTSKDGYVRNNLLTSQGVTDYLNSINMSNYQKFNQYEDRYDQLYNEYFKDQGGVSNWGKVDIDSPISPDGRIKALQSDFRDKGETINNALATGFKTYGNSGDNAAGKWQDGLFGYMTQERTLGRGVDEGTQKAWNAILNPKGLEYYINETGGGRIRPIATKTDGTAAMSTDATPTEQEYIDNDLETAPMNTNTSEAISGSGRNGLNIRLKPEDLLATSRWLSSIRANNRVTKDLKAAMKPTLINTYENYVPQTENYIAKTSVYNQAANMQSMANRMAKETSDSTLGVAARLAAMRDAAAVRLQGDLANEQRLFETGNLSRAESNAAKARRTEVANQNKASMNAVNYAKAQLDANRRMTNWQSTDRFLQGIESNYRQARAITNQNNFNLANKLTQSKYYGLAQDLVKQLQNGNITQDQYQISMQDLQKQAAIDNTRTANDYFGYDYMFQRYPVYAKKGGSLSAQDKKEIQYSKDFNSMLRNSQNNFYKQLISSKKMYTDYIGKLSSYTAKLINKGMLCE